MSERDIEKDVDRGYFVETLRRIADAVEAGESFRIQVANTRFAVPADASLVVEHEVEEGAEELSLEFQWAASDD